MWTSELTLTLWAFNLFWHLRAHQIVPGRASFCKEFVICPCSPQQEGSRERILPAGCLWCTDIWQEGVLCHFDHLLVSSEYNVDSVTGVTILPHYLVLFHLIQAYYSTCHRVLSFCLWTVFQSLLFSLSSVVTVMEAQGGWTIVPMLPCDSSLSSTFMLVQTFKSHPAHSHSAIQNHALCH